MLTTTESYEGASTPHTETAERPVREFLERERIPDEAIIKAVGRVETPADGRPVLALFCYEDAGSAVGKFAASLAAALARRRVAVHVFSRRDFQLDAAGVSVHAVGEGGAGGLLDQVQDFTT